MSVVARWNEEDQCRILRAVFAPGATVAAVARQYDVATSLVYEWRRTVRAAPRQQLGATSALTHESGPYPRACPTSPVTNMKALHRTAPLHDVSISRSIADKTLSPLDELSRDEQTNCSRNVCFSCSLAQDKKHGRKREQGAAGTLSVKPQVCRRDGTTVAVPTLEALGRHAHN
ncbi:transposase [Mesorhizobium sp. ORM16]|uniref:transposase n=1 Tax=Mesorhizobium sp. ORM16 TaxID=3376989 RepID=UPI003857BF3D